MLLLCRVPQSNGPTDEPLSTLSSLLLSQAALQQMTCVRVILLGGRQTCTGFHSDEGKKRSNVRCAPLSPPFPKHSLLCFLQAVNAAKYGVAGVLVYTDPKDINDGKSLPNETFPHSWCLPPSGVERGSYFEYFGDPLTPYLPAMPSSFRLNSDNASGFPPIPIQPIGFEDAQVLLW